MTDKELHQQFSEFGCNSNKWKHQCKLLLPEIAKRKIWQKRGFGSLYEYAAKIAGMSKASVYETIWILRKLEDKPKMRKVAEEKGLTRVRPLMKIITKENEAELAKKANKMSKAALEAYREKFMPGNKNTSRLTLELPTPLVEKMKRIGNLNELFAKFINALDEPSTNKLSKETPTPKRTDSRHIPIKIRQHVIQRTNGYCAFPGCTKKFSSLHHTQRFSLDRIHDPNKLHGLCTGHERIAHLGLIKNENQAPSNWSLLRDPEYGTAKHWIDQLVALYRPG